MTIDLHIHSVHSDGTYTPYEIASLAKKRGLTAISLTDHDTISGTKEAITAARELEIEALPGIELSVQHNDYNLHIIGYLFDYENQELIKKISVLQEARKERNAGIIKKLNTLGIDISLPEVESISQIGQTGRPHIAQLLCRKGVVRNLNEAFAKYLAKGQKAYASRFVYSSAEAISIIKKSGGLAILAHPYQVNPTLKETENIVKELVSLGLDGLEVYYPTHSAKIRKKLKTLVKKYDLVASGGSDYHGIIRPGTELAGGVNVYVPYEILAKLKQKWQAVNILAER